MSFDQEIDVKYVPLEEMQTSPQKKSKEPITEIENLLIYLHSFSHIFQGGTLILSILISLIGGSHVFTFVYMFLTPNFYLNSDKSKGKRPNEFQYKLTFLVVSEEQACGKDFTTKVLFESITSEFSLYCEQSHLKHKYQFYIFLMSSVIALLFILVLDLFGRKKMVLICYLVATVGFIFTYFMDDIIFKLIGILLLWAFMEMVSPALGLLSNELLVNPIRNFSFIFYTIMLCVGGLLGNFLTTKFAGYQTLVLFIFTGYSCILIFIFLVAPESPYYLLKRKKYDELRKVIVRIATYNRLNDEQLQKGLDDLESIIKRNSINVLNF